MTENDWEKFAKDVISSIKEKAFESRKINDRELNDFNSGYLTGYYGIMSSIINSCVNFQIDQKEISLNNYKAEDLIN